MNIKRHLTAIMAILLISIGMSRATDQVPYSFLVKTNGTWSLWSNYLNGDAIIIKNTESKTKRVLRLRELISEEEYQHYETTAGADWGAWSLWYFCELDKHSFFRIRTEYGSDILLDLDRAKRVPVEPHQEKITQMDREYISTVLQGADTVFASSDMTVSDADQVHAAILHSIDYRMTNCISYLRRIEAVDYIGAGVLPSGSDPYTKQAPIDTKVSYWHYTFYETRRLTNLALRRSNAKPKGFPAMGFLPKDKGQPVTAAERETGLKELRVGMTPTDVYKTLGPPDYIEVIREWGEWRYDVDAAEPYSILVGWNKHGLLNTADKCTPALWHGNALFVDTPVGQVFRSDGSIRVGEALFGKSCRMRVLPILPKSKNAQQIEGSDS